MKSQIAFAAALLASASLVACQILLGIEDTGVPAPSSSSGATASSSGGSSGSSARCTPDPLVTARPPGPPDAGARDADTDAEAPDGADDLPPLVFAIRTLALGGDPASFGYDIDGQFTTDTSSPQCYTPSGTAALDDPGGRDNAAATVLARRLENVGQKPELLSQSIQEDLDEGKGTTLFRLSGYNGQANDDRVLIQVASSPGLYREDPDASVLALPKWDGTDIWFMDVNRGGAPGDLWYVKPTIAGYVVDHHLIVQQRDELDQLRFPLFGRGVDFKKGVLSARFTEGEAGRLEFRDGMMAGAAAPIEVYQLMREVPLFKGARVCRLSSIGFGSACADLVNGADIPNPAYCDGNVEPTAPCETISLSFGFTAVRAEAMEAPLASDAGVSDPDNPPCGPFDAAAECFETTQP